MLNNCWRVNFEKKRKINTGNIGKYILRRNVRRSNNRWKYVNWFNWQVFTSTPLRHLSNNHKTKAIVIAVMKRSLLRWYYGLGTKQTLLVFGLLVYLCVSFSSYLELATKQSHLFREYEFVFLATNFENFDSHLLEFWDNKDLREKGKKKSQKNNWQESVQCCGIN